MRYYSLINSMSRGGSALDADVQAYITANGETDNTFIGHLNTLVLGLKSDGLYSGIQMWHIYRSSTTQTKFNFINPVDSDGANRLTFNGSFTINNDGMVRTSGNPYAETYFVPSSVQNVNSNGMTIVCGTNTNALTNDVEEMGAINSLTQSSILYLKNNGTDFGRGCRINAGSIFLTGTSESRGIFTATKQSSTVSKFIRNNSVLGTGSGGGTLPNVSVYINAINVNGSASGFSNQRIQQTMMHIGFSDAQVTILHSLIDTFENALGRKTW